MTFNCWKFKGGKSKGCSVCAIALLSFTAGSLITARLAHIDHVRADSNRVFELRIYHTVPGKLPALESRFRDIYSKLLAKHDLQVVGYWVPEGQPIGTTHSYTSWLIPAGRKLKRTGTRCWPTRRFRKQSNPRRPTSWWKR